MRREIHEYLDGELDLGLLDPELREEVRRWERLLAELRAAGPLSAPAGLEARILAAIGAPLRRPGWQRTLAWAVRPRPVRVPPLAAVAAAAAIALFVWLPRRFEVPAPQAGGETIVYVQFVLEAPWARSVAVAGDFNAWSPDIPLSDPDGDGVWTGRVAVAPGMHQYMFVIDGARWMADPRAERYTDDEFGQRNAVLVVPGPSSRS